MPPPRGYPRAPKTLGDHLKKTRLDRRLRQNEVAAEFGVDYRTVSNWERNSPVAARFLPKVVAFLGYDPREESGHLGERIRTLRERQGLSQEALAERLGVNASTVTRWERGRVKKLFPKVKRRFEELLREDGSPSLREILEGQS